MSASKVLSVKISADAQIRRFTIPAEGTAAAQYEALQKVLRENYSDKLKAGAALKFADDEGDYCVLSSAAEFAEAVRLLGNPPATLKLFLTATVAAPAAPAPAPAPAAAAKPAAAPAPAPAAKPAAAAAAPAPAKVYPVLPAKPAAPAPAPAKPAAAAAAAPAKPVAAAAPKVEAAPKPAAAAKAAPVPAPAAPKKEETPKAADAKAAAAAAAAADAPKDEWEAKREKCRAFRKQLHATVSDAKVRAALKELVAPAIQAVEAIANGSDKRSLSAVLTALVTGSPVLAANEFVAKTLLPRGVEKLERVDALVRPFLPAVVPFLPLAAVHLPDQIDRLAERLEQREKFAEQWRAAKAAGVAGKGTDCKSRGAFGKAFGCGGPFMRGGCGPFGLLRTLFRGTAEAGAEGKDGEDAAACGGFPKELKDLFRALRGHGPHVPRDGHHGHHWRRHGGCHRSRSRDNKEEATAAAGTAAGPAAAAADKAAAPEKTADGKVIHYQVTCDGCGVSPITGVRYKCQVCRNFDLCEACEAGAAKHPADHALLKIRVSRWNADGRRNRSPAPAAPTGPAVHHVICDGCNASPIVGVRYKCQTCPDFDLCAKCEEAGKHSEHTFLKMKSADVAPAARGGRHGHGHGHRFGGHGHHHGPHPHGPFGFPFGPFAFGAGPHGPHRHPHPHSPRGWGRRFGGFGASSASGSGSGSGSGSSGSDSESDQARAVAALVADLLAQNPFLASAIEGVEVRNAAPDSADPNTASVPLNAAAGPAALLAALLPAVFTKQTAAKAAAAPVPKTADASTATATADAPAAVAKDEKGEPVNKPAVAATATAAAAPAKPVTPVTGGKKAEREAARASKVDADVEALKAMGFTGHPDDVLRQLLTVAEVKKHRRFHSNVQWVVDALLSGDADKYL